MPRFEFSDDKSNKFWTIELNDDELLLAWGRIGTTGRSKTKSFDSVGEARKEYDRLIRQKTRKGYELVAGEETADAEGVESAEVNSSTFAQRVHWTDEQRELVYPRRGSNWSFEAPTADVAEIYEWMTTRLFDQRSLDAIGAGRKKGDHRCADMVRGVVGFFEDGAELSVRTAAAMLVFGSYRTSDLGPMIAWFAQTEGVVFATKVLAESLLFHRDGGGDELWIFPVSHASNYMTKRWEAANASTAVAGRREAAALELRRWLAAADPSTYDDAREVAREALSESSVPRQLDTPRRAILVIAFPDETDWVEMLSDAEFAELEKRKYPFVWNRSLLASVSDVDLAVRLVRMTLSSSYSDPDEYRARTFAVMLSVVERLGADAMPVFEAFHDWGEAWDWRSGLQPIESVEAFRLLSRSGAQADEHLASMRRRPELAAFALAPVAVDRRRNDSGAARVHLAMLADEAPDATARAARELDGEAAAFLRSLLEPSPDLAAPDELPAILREPPWLRKKPTKQVAVKGLDRLEFDPKIHWAEGERQASLKALHDSIERLSDRYEMNDDAIEARLRRAHENRDYYWWGESIRNLVWLDSIDVARRLWESLDTDFWGLSEERGIEMLAKWGTDALDFFDLVAPHDRRFAVGVLQQVEDPRFAPLMAFASARLKTARDEARAWLFRFPRAAAIGLLLDALGKTKRARGHARRALHLLREEGHGDVLRDVAAEYGDARVVDGVEQLLSERPEDVFPHKIPTMPFWWRPEAFGPIVAEGTGKEIGPEFATHVGTMFAFSTLDEPYAGLDVVAEYCTPGSLEEFALQAFRAWLRFGADSEQYWALHALAFVGRDEAVRTLAPMIRRWPGESAAKRAKVGLDVLAAIGTELALMQIYAISQKVRYKSIEKRAGELVDEIAADLGLSRAELGDRLVPDLGLEPDGSTTIDYGTRKFVVRLDESLKPVVVDESGKTRKSLPKPGKKDGEIAVEESKRFKGLKKDLRAVAKRQVERLERAMTAGRRWKVDDFRRFMVGHPLVLNLTRRLVWGCYDEAGELVGTFRVTSDHAFTDLEDDDFTIPTARVGIPHALELDASTLAEWGVVLADYRLAQPFEQLNRDLFTTDAVDDVIGVTLPAPTLVFGLERFGWRRHDVIDGGAFTSHTKDFGEYAAYVDYDGAVGMGFIEETEPLTLRSLEFFGPDGAVGLDVAPPVVVSEALRDLVRVVNNAG